MLHSPVDARNSVRHESLKAVAVGGLNLNLNLSPASAKGLGPWVKITQGPSTRHTTIVQAYTAFTMSKIGRYIAMTMPPTTHAEEHDHHRLHQREQADDGRVDFLVVEVGDLRRASHRVAPVCSPTAIIEMTIGGKTCDSLSGAALEDNPSRQLAKSWLARQVLRVQRRARADVWIRSLRRRAMAR